MQLAQLLPAALLLLSAPAVVSSPATMPDAAPASHTVVATRWFGFAVKGSGETKSAAMNDADRRANEIATKMGTCITPAKLEDVVKDPDQPGWWIATAYVANHKGSCP